MAKTFVPNGKTRIGDARRFGMASGSLSKAISRPWDPAATGSAASARRAQRWRRPKPAGASARAAQQRIDCFVQQDGGVFQGVFHRALERKVLEDIGHLALHGLASCAS
jgi:hypothetical protein